MRHKSHSDSEVVSSRPPPPPPPRPSHAVTMYVYIRPCLFLLCILCTFPSPIQSAPPCSSRAALLLRRYATVVLSVLRTSALSLSPQSVISKWPFRLQHRAAVTLQPEFSSRAPAVRRTQCECATSVISSHLPVRIRNEAAEVLCVLSNQLLHTSPKILDIQI